MGREVLNRTLRPDYNRAMPGIFTKVALLTIALIAATSADGQTRRKREPHEVERPPPAAPVDKRDSVVTAVGGFAGRPYWLAVAQCGGIYFKLNLFYADAAAHARVVKPDPRATAEYTKNLTEAIKTATTYFDAAERFLMTDRGIEHTARIVAQIDDEPLEFPAARMLQPVHGLFQFGGAGIGEGGNAQVTVIGRQQLGRH